MSVALAFTSLGTWSLTAAIAASFQPPGRNLCSSVVEAASTNALKARRAEARIRSEIESVIERGPRKLLVSSTLAVQMREACASRRKSLEEKARGNLAALSISASFSTAGLTFGSNHPRIALLLIVPLFYFALAAYASVRVLQVGEVYVLTAEEELRNDAARLGLWYTELNDLGQSQKANWLYVSYKALRNAIISLVSLVGIGVVLLLK